MLPNQTNNYVERPPRIQPPLPIHEVEIPTPPDKNTIHQQSIIELLLPLVTIAAYLLLAVAGRGRSIWLMIPMALAMLGSIFVSLRRANEAKEIAERKRAAYDRRLAELRQKLRNDHQLQRDFYHYNYPSPQTVLSIAKEDEVSRSGSRIWERRLNDQDFGVVRLGIGTRESTVVYKLSQQQNDEDPQMNDAQRLAQDSRFIDEVPVTLQLRPPVMETPLHDVQHTLGIYALGAGPSSSDHRVRFEPLYDYVRGLLLHFAVFHSPRDAHLYIIGTQAASEAWGWIQNLQHVHMGQNREEDLMCFEGEQVSMEDGAPAARLPLFLRELRNALIIREQRLKDQDVSAGSVTVPHMLLVVDLLGVTPNSLLSDIESNETIAMIIAKGRALGVSVIFLAEEPDHVPSDTQAVVELETLERGRTVFRYAEIGMNAPRYVGDADRVNANFAERFVEAIRNFDIRASAAASLVAAVDLLEMNSVVDIDELSILENWRRSRTASGAEWPRVPIGMKNANEPPREVTFSASKDGVHGMIAGTTGSGKSEMLLTLIVGLAINYDPSVVNFVLVDFKGGAAFEEFKTLPHCVDIVTNLGANAVDRMFSAIKAELDRRGEMVAQYRVKHIVDFRKQNYHLEPPEFTDKLPAQPFPHLFIIVDEFAEMVSENPEYKAQLDSITRLGRAIGVSLILATQKPGGAITDQMRANMKMKICLRVETPEDSRELLRRADAAFLPTSIPGRAYLQIGNEPPELVQVARAGGPYRRSQKVEQQEVIWLTREKKQPQQLKTAEDKVKPISTAIVDVMAEEAKRPENAVAPQRKPWPNPLPKYLPLGINLWDLHQVDPTYLKDDQMLLHDGRIPPRGERTPTYLVKEMRAWLDALEYAEQHPDEAPVFHERLGWDAVDWEEDVLSVPIGLIDHPRQARLRLLDLSLLDGNIVIMGTTGWGKTTFLRTLITALAVKYPPSAIHMYVLDFGGRNLMVFKNLPHVGAVITPEDTERIDRLIRFLNNTLDERKERINNANTDDLISYNIAASGPGSDLEPIPAILVMIDNFAEIKDNFEGLIPTLMSLFREGRNAGIFFAATADSPGAMGGKSFALFSQRFALRQNDKGDFLPIVGRGAAAPIEAYGRGLMAVERAMSDVPLEFQVAAPIPAFGLEYKQDASFRDLDDEDTRPRSREIDEDRTIDKLAAVMSRRLELLVSLLATRWEALSEGATRALPEEMRRLADHIDVTELFEVSESYPPDDVSVPLGTRDLDLEPLWVNLENNPNFAILGPPLSGRTTMLRTWVLMLAHRFPPSEVAMVLVDMQKRLHDYRGGSHSLADLPHVREVVTEEDQLADFVERLRFEYEFQRPSNDADLPADVLAQLPDVPRPQVFVFIDNYDDLTDVLNEDRNIKRAYESMGKLARSYGTFGLHIILAGGDDTNKGSDAVTKQVWQSRLGFSMKLSKYAEGKFQAKVDKPLRDQEFNNGRGLYIQSGRSELVQIATPEPANKSLSFANTMNAYVQEIIDRYADEVAAFNARYGTNVSRLPWYYEMVPAALRGPEEEAEATPEATPPKNGKTTGAGAARKGSALPDIDFLGNGGNKPAPTASSVDRKRKEYAIQIDKMRGRLGADKLSRMPLGLLRDLPLRYGDMDQAATAAFLHGKPEDEINALLDSGALQLPTDLEEGLNDRVTAWWRAYRTITGEVITRYPLSFLQNELGIAFGSHDPQAVQEMDPDAVQALIDQHEITLPRTIDHATLMSIQQPPADMLTGEMLVALAEAHPNEFEEMKIVLHDLTPADVAEMSPPQVKGLVEAGRIDLPLVLPGDKFKVLRGLRKSLRRDRKTT